MDGVRKMREVYAELAAEFSQESDVVVNTGTGAQGMKFGGRMFVMFFKGDILAALPPKRVSELIGEGRGLPHDPGTGKVMPDRILVPAERSDEWIGICRESLEYFRGERK